MRAAMHLAAGDDVDARDLLLKDRGLHGAQLRVGKIARGQLSKRHQAGRRPHTIAARYGRR